MAVTENVALEPTVKVALAPLSIEGAWSTVSVNDWTSDGLMPFAAVIER